MLRVLHGVVPRDVSSKGVACEDEVLEVSDFYSPFFDVGDKVVDTILRTEFESKVVVRAAATTHADDVDEINTENGRESFHHFIE